VVSYYENRGYPFCAVSLDSFKLQNGKAFAKLLINPDLQMTFDTIEYIGSTKVRKSFLRSYLGLLPGKKYSEEVFSKVVSRLKLLPFVELTSPSSVMFENEKAKPKLYLKDRKSSQFDLLIGLLPGSSGQRVLITADIFIHLVSPFGMGEEMKVKWQKLQPKTQTLDVHLVYPYLLGIPLGINAKFDLFKVDTSFLNLNGEYGVQYQLGGPDVVKLAYRNRSTIVLFTDTNFIKQTNRLPQNLDVSSNEVMMELNLQRLNYRFNPTSGFQMKFATSFGIKKIKKSNTIATLFDSNTGSTFNRLYDSIRLNTFTTELSFSIDKFWKINRRNTIRTNAEGVYIFNQLITQNELYRIGGLNSLRGFDDRSILTPYYLMANLEYRFLISRNAFFFLFFNSALVKENRFFKNKPFDFPFGFGAGSTIETKIGMFALSYAIGTQQNQSFTFRSGKIHFGYINFF
jgi:outer membrane protein assembly factor BamA